MNLKRGQSVGTCLRKFSRLRPPNALMLVARYCLFALLSLVLFVTADSDQCKAKHLKKHVELEIVVVESESSLIVSAVVTKTVLESASHSHTGTVKKPSPSKKSSPSTPSTPAKSQSLRTQSSPRTVKSGIAAASSLPVVKSSLSSRS